MGDASPPPLAEQDTTKQLTITLENPFPLPVSYQWMFIEECEMVPPEDLTGRPAAARSLGLWSSAGGRGRTMSSGAESLTP